jgi:hypothetical protein
MASNIIKKTGTYKNTSSWETSGALYTCPANTSALILPSVAMNADSANAVFAIAYTHTAAITNNDYNTKSNFYVYANQSNGKTWLTNDGNRQVFCGENGYSVAYYSPSTGSASTHFLSHVGLNLSFDGNQSVPWEDGGSTKISLGVWVMEPGNVLSVACAPYMWASWSFTIFEESFA